LLCDSNTRKLWVEALRSGEYKQTTGFLCRIAADGQPIGHCCLGVACELFSQSERPLQREVICGLAHYNGAHTAELPAIVRDWLGINSSLGQFDRMVGGCLSLSALNDKGGESFEQIARVIETPPDGLCVDIPKNAPESLTSGSSTSAT
jgi:hypothetical protein